MFHQQEKWDFEFLKNFVPKFLSEAELNQNWLQRIVRSLSEFHHRCNSILYEIPPQFTIQSMEDFYSDLKVILQTVSIQNNEHFEKLNKIFMSLRIIKYELNQNFNQAQTKCKQLELGVREKQCHKILCQQQLKTIQNELQSQKIICKFQDSFNKNRYYNSLSVKKVDMISERVEKYSKQLQSLETQRNSVLAEYNNKLRRNINAILQSFCALSRHRIIQQNFQTFQRRTVNSSNKQIIEDFRQKPAVSDFSNMNQGIQDLIKKAEHKCQEEVAEIRIPTKNYSDFFKAAAKAQSRQVIELPSDKKITDSPEFVIEDRREYTIRMR